MKEPVERIMGKISKMSQDTLQKILSHLDIDRSFYPLLLIEAGKGITQQELANELSCDKVQVVRIIDYLSLNGYVDRIQNKTDKRKYELVVTEKAKTVIPDIKKAFKELSAVSLKGLTETQKNELYTILVTIESNLYNT
ncbi:MAG: MarR family transcriptional regulator [Paludibacter sp.]|nr:MarR family transcriptional regulator [Paludibacter sp.]